MSGVVLRHGLFADEASRSTLRQNHRNGYFAVALYSLLSVAALWFPNAIAIVTTLTWVFWLVLGLRMKHA